MTYGYEVREKGLRPLTQSIGCVFCGEDVTPECGYGNLVKFSDEGPGVIGWICPDCLAGDLGVVMERLSQRIARYRMAVTVLEVLEQDIKQLGVSWPGR